MNVRPIHCLFFLLSATLFGCGGGPEPSELKTYPVMGKVLAADGQPLTGGIIQFMLPEDPSRTISSMIAEDGSFELKTMDGNQNLSGAIEGECKVLVTLPFGPGEVPETVKLSHSVLVNPGENDLVIQLEKGA